MQQGLKATRPNPLDRANLLSVITFGYTFPTFLKGYRRRLEEEDIPQVLEKHDTEHSGDILEKYWAKQKSSRTPSLWKAVGRGFGIEFLLLGIGVFFDEIFLKLVRSLALIQLVRYYSNDSETIGRNDAYVYGGLIVGASFVSAFVNQLTQQHLQVLGMRLRTACACLVYRKSLKLSKSALQKISVGQLTNILSNDLRRFNENLSTIHYLWICPIQIIIVVFLLYNLMGLAGTVGILFMVLLVPLLVYFGKKCSEFRLKTAIRTDERVRLMSEIITGITLIKMYAWEKPFTKLIDTIRRLETREIRSNNYIRGFLWCVTVTPSIAVFLVVAVSVITGNGVTAVYIFGATSFYENLRTSLTVYFPVGITLFAEIRVCINRIEKLLLSEEIGSNKLFIARPAEQQNCKQVKKGMVNLDQVSAMWNGNSVDLTLRGVTLKAESNQLVGIVGPVGNGKSSIFQVILNELPLQSGTVNVEGEISYASQEPWIFSGNIQKNILLGQPMELERYNAVLKACALETDISHLPYGDQTLVGERGVTLSGGQRARVNLARAIYRNADVYLLDEPFSAVDPHVGKHIFEQCISIFLHQKCVIIITNQTEYLSKFDYIYVLEGGQVTSSGTYQQLQLDRSRWLSEPPKVEQNNTNPCNDLTSTNEETLSSDTVRDSSLPVVVKEHRSAGGVSKTVFTAYLKAGGSLLACGLILMVYVISQVAYSSSDYFIAYWVNEKQRQAEDDYYIPESETTSMCIYTCLILVMSVLTLLRTYMLFNYSSRISIGIHASIFRSTVNTAMDFFHLNNSGRILNRFSKDIGVIDEYLPVIVMESIQICFTILGGVINISIVKPWLLLGSAMIFVVFYFLRSVYTATSCSVSRLEGTSLSPVFGHVTETMQGLTSIRASNSQSLLEQEFNCHQNLHSSIWYTQIACTRAFRFYTEIVCVCYISATTFSMILYQSEQYGGNVGLAITQAIGILSLIQWAMYQTSQLENQMTSAERVIEYTKLIPEDTRDNNIELADTWPEFGTISFKNVSLRYKSHEPYVLKDINFDIESLQKIGIVGRTGAGKSSLIAALFQMTSTEGIILIDNINIAQLSLHNLRSKLSIIPQDPILFSGTVKSNLDPFGYYSDIDLWTALEDVELKTFVSELPSGLDYVVLDGGSNFSVGQRQLICLARAIIKQHKILVLDEATANVDNDTDALIQNTIRRKFLNCTVITIAHRLNTIIDSDKVLVIDAGKVVEYDHPHVLLQNINGLFYSMIQQTGPETANSLTNIAKDMYKDRKSN